MNERDRRNEEAPHDTLAAEEFAIGTRFERWPAYPASEGAPHDTLAAEEFGIGTPDMRMPRDPSGYHTPHDILAAEAFAMPLPDQDAAPPRPSSRSAAPVLVALAAALGVAALVLSRR